VVSGPETLRDGHEAFDITAVLGADLLVGYLGERLSIGTGSNGSPRSKFLASQPPS